MWYKYTHLKQKHAHFPQNQDTKWKSQFAIGKAQLKHSTERLPFLNDINIHTSTCCHCERKIYTQLICAYLKRKNKQYGPVNNLAVKPNEIHNLLEGS